MIKSAVFRNMINLRQTNLSPSQQLDKKEIKILQSEILSQFHTHLKEIHSLANTYGKYFCSLYHILKWEQVFDHKAQL
jgi:hypothetical protein